MRQTLRPLVNTADKMEGKGLVMAPQFSACFRLGAFAPHWLFRNCRLYRRKVRGGSISLGENRAKRRQGCVRFKAPSALRLGLTVQCRSRRLAFSEGGALNLATGLEKGNFVANWGDGVEGDFPA